MDELTISTKLDTKGFTAGSKQLLGAIKSFGNTADKAMATVQKQSRSAIATISKWGPALLGVTSAYGIIRKAVSTFMSENQQLSANFQSAWTAIGNVLGPVITKLVNLITSAVSYLITFLKLLGLTTKSASEASKSGKNAAGALEKERRQLMGFDELNVLQEDSSGGGGVTGSLEDIDPSEWMKKLAEMLKQGAWHEVANLIVQKMNELTDLLDKNIEEWAGKLGYYVDGLLTILADVLKKYNWKNLGRIFAKGINKFIASVNWRNLGYILVRRFTAFFELIFGVISNLDYKLIGQALYEIIDEALKELIRFLGQKDEKGRSIGEQIGETILDGIKKFWDGLTSNGKGAELTEKFFTALGLLLKVPIDFGHTIVKAIGENLTTWWQKYSPDPSTFNLSNLLEAIKKSWSDIKSWIYQHIVSPFFSALGIQFETGTNGTRNTSWIQILKDKIRAKVVELFGENSDFVKMFDTISERIESVWSKITSFLNGNGVNDGSENSGETNTGGIEALFAGLLSFFGDLHKTIQGALAAAWTSITDFLLGKTETESSGGEDQGPESLIQKVINVINNLNVLAGGLAEGASKLISDFLAGDGQGGKSGLETILDGVNTVLSSIQQTVSDHKEDFDAIYNDFLKPMSKLVFTFVVKGLTDIVDALGKFVEFLAGKTSFAEFWGDLSPAQKALSGIAVAFGLIKAVIATGTFAKNLTSSIDAIRMLFGLGGSAGGIAGAAGTAGKAVGAMQPLIGSFKDLWAAIQLGAESIGGASVLGPIAALVGSIVFANHEVKEMNKATKETAFEGLDDSVESYATALERLSSQMEETQTAIENLSNSGGDLTMAQNSLTSQSTVFGEVLQELAEKLGVSKDYLSTMWEVADGNVEKFLELTSAINTSADSIKKVSALEEEWNTLRQLGRSSQQGYNLLIQQQDDILGELVPLLLNQGKTYKEIADELGITTQKVEQMAEATIESSTAVSSAAENAKDLADSNENVDSTADKAVSGIERVAGAAEEASDTFEEAGNSSVEGFIKGIQDGLQNMKNAVSQFGTGSGNALSESLQVNSPSKVTEDIGSGFVEGFDLGIEENADVPVQSVRSLANNVTKVFEDSVGDSKNSGNKLINDLNNGINTGKQTVISTVLGVMNDILSNIAKTSIEIETVAADSMEQINSDSKNLGTTLTSLVSTTGQTIASSWSTSCRQMVSISSSSINNIRNVVRTGLSSLSSEAYRWGYDMMYQFASGMSRGSSLVNNVLNRLTTGIRSVLHFSVPDEGPLSDADQWMPDFMKLMAKGIDDNKNKPLNAVSSLADGIAAQFQQGDYRFGADAASSIDASLGLFSDTIIGSFTNLLNQLQMIAERVTFNLPDMAKGNVLPYAATGGTGFGNSTFSEDVVQMKESLDDIYNALEQLRIQGILNRSNSDDNPRFELIIDGQRITDVVTRRQRQQAIARGNV